jgi:DNA-binding NarL/FixJ family response regulator
MAPRLETSEDLVAAGHAALARADWSDARARFESAVAAEASPEALEGLSRAVWWLGDEEATFSTRERAYRAYRDAADAHGAARMAMWIASDQFDFRGDDALAGAWLRKGRALVENEPPSVELAYIAALESDVALLGHSDTATSRERAIEALALARTIADPGIESVALALLGSAMIAAGDAEEGLVHLEEAGALAVGEDFSEPAAPGWALCHTVSAFSEVGDFDRAEQWCRALHTWSAEWRARHFFGVCRTAYGEVLATGGDWPAAEEELQSAMDDMRTTRPALAAPTAVRLGRLRARQGKATEARALFEAAQPLPEAIVGLGELDLAAGDANAACDAAERALRRLGDSSILARFRALELLARARAANGDAGGALALAAELHDSAARLGTPYMRGRAQLVRAQVLSATDEYDEARQAAEDAADLFASCSAPYEGAEARLVLATALGGLGRREHAEAESRAAQAAFAELGAVPRPAPGSGELSPREADILRLIANGKGDAQIAEQLFLSPHTVHRHVANIRSKLRVPSRAAAVAYATRNGLV